MPDLTMCRQWRCMHCRNCLRFRATPNDTWQSYFAEDPAGGDECPYSIVIPNDGIVGWIRYVRVRLEDELGDDWAVETWRHDAYPVIEIRVSKALANGRGRVNLSVRTSQTALTHNADGMMSTFVRQAREQEAASDARHAKGERDGS